MGVYLDYNASTPIDRRVLDKMIEVYADYYGNADSRTHLYGTHAHSVVETAREHTAALFNCRKEEVYFTSGATESNNIAVFGLKKFGLENKKNHIITTAIEHKSVLEPMKILEAQGFTVEYVKPSENGSIRAEDVLGRLRDSTLFVSVMHVNNETGTIQPVEEIGKELSKKNVYFHIDASQSCGKLVREIQRLDFDMMSVAAHKMYGPQGIGALILKYKNSKRPPLTPLMYGGGQEKGIRPGTLPSALIAGLGEACRLSLEEYEQNHKIYKKNKHKLLNILNSSGVNYKINGDLENSIDTTLNISFHDYDSEALMLGIKEWLGVSNGSACTSHAYDLSYVLKAMGLPEKRIEEAVRISWGREPIDPAIFERLTETVKNWQNIFI